jgi:hypothetical protein
MAILQVTYDPAWAAVRVVVDGGMWPSAVASIRLVRTSASEGVVPVRGVERLVTAGGYWIGTDHEMPLGEAIQYTVAGYAANGTVVASESASVTTTSTACELWIKAPGRPDLSRPVKFRTIGDVAFSPRGSNYQIARGGAVAQTSGMDTESLSLVVGVDGPGEVTALERLVRGYQTILLQHGGEPEFTPGWYMVTSMSRSNPAQKVYGIYAKRDFTLNLEATSRPAGVGVAATGVSWATVMQQHATWADVLATVPTWFDLQKGA